MAIITTEVKKDFLQQWIESNVKKIVVKILQGSVVTQTMLGGLAIIILGLQISYCTVLYICAKNYENWLAVDKVKCKNNQAYFLAHPVEWYD